MTAPMGYHIHLCSSTQFVFGDEERVMAELTKVSQGHLQGRKVKRYDDILRAM